MNEIERERWRGKVDAELTSVQENVRILFRAHKELDGDLQKLEILLTALRGSVQTLAMKIGILSGAGAILGSGLMQYALSLLKH